MVLLVLFANLSIWYSFAIGQYFALPTTGGVLFSGFATPLGTFAGSIVRYGASGSKRLEHT
jgi:hypothetical protein